MRTRPVDPLHAQVRLLARLALRAWPVTVALVAWPVVGMLGAIAVGLVATLAYVVMEARRAKTAKGFGGERAAGNVARQVVHSWPNAMRVARLRYEGNVVPYEWSEGAHPVGEKLRRLIAELRGDYSSPYTPLLVAVRPSVLGVTFVAQMLPGHVLGDYQAAAASLAVTWRVRDVRVTAGQDYGEVDITVVLRDPLAKQSPLPPTAPGLSLDLRAIPVAVQEDGTPFTVALVDVPGTLVGGVPGSGKSRLLSVLLAQLAGHPHVEVYGIDLKGGLELRPWSHRLTQLATSHDEAVALLEGLEAEMHRRWNELVCVGESSFAHRGASEQLPLIVLIVDEAADLFLPLSPAKQDREIAERAQRLVSSLVRRGRAAGVATVLCTQRPTFDVIPTQIRDNCSQRIALRCTTNEQAKAILGDLLAVSPMSPTSIPASQVGTAVAANASGAPTRCRTFRITDTEIAARSSAGATFAVRDR